MDQSDVNANCSKVVASWLSDYKKLLNCIDNSTRINEKQGQLSSAGFDQTV